MKGSALGRRYAGALISIGKKSGQVERYGKELVAAKEMLTENKTWTSFTSPLLPNEAKSKIIDEIGKRSGWSDSVTNFLKLLVDKKRIKFLSGIVDAFLALADEEAGRVHAVLESATALDDATKARLTQKLVSKLNKKVILEDKVDSSLIGGVRVSVGSTVIDGTIRGQLAHLRDLLKKE